MTGYRPMTVADLAACLSRTGDDKTRWKLVWEFLEEYRWEQAEARPAYRIGDDGFKAELTRMVLAYLGLPAAPMP